MVARRTHEAHRVGGHLVADVERADGVLEAMDAAGRKNLLDRLEGFASIDMSTGDARLSGRVRVPHPDPDEEAIELRLRQREGAFVLDRVLRGEDDEWLRQRPCHSLERHLALLHCLKERGLRAWRRAVHLVDE